MTPASDLIRTAATALLTGGAGADALRAVGVAAPAEGGVAVSPEQGTELPYVEVQGASEVEGPRADGVRRTDVVLQLVARARSLRQTEAVARTLVDVLCRRIAVDGVQILGATLSLYGRAVQDPPPGARPWALPVQILFTTSQPAAAGE